MHDDEPVELKADENRLSELRSKHGNALRSYERAKDKAERANGPGALAAQSISILAGKPTTVPLHQLGTIAMEKIQKRKVLKLDREIRETRLKILRKDPSSDALSEDTNRDEATYREIYGKRDEAEREARLEKYGMLAKPKQAELNQAKPKKEKSKNKSKKKAAKGR